MKFISEFGPIPEAAMGMGYWVKGNTVYDMTADRHVKFIEENPQLFDITPEEIEQAFVSSNEKKGTEGNAREQLVKRVAENGWLRVRHYEKPDYWSIQCDNIKRREHTIENFIYWCIENKLMTYSSSAIILGYDKPEDKLVYDWQEGGVKGFLIRETRGMSDFRTIEDRREDIISVYENLIEHHSIIAEASLSRVLQHGEKGFMIMSAFRSDATFDENFINSVKLRKMLKEKKFGFFELLGHWDESLEKREGSASQRLRKSIQKAKELHKSAGGNTEVSVELSYFIPYTDKYKIDYKTFVKEGGELASFFNQFSYIAYNPTPNVIEEIKSNDGKVLQIWNGVSVVNISKAYSRMRTKLNKSFLYEGASLFGSVLACWAGDGMGYIMSENSYFIELKMQQKQLKESSWSRIIQHIEKGEPFAVLSAFRKENKKEANYELHEALRGDIQKLGYGYIEQKSGYTYTQQDTGKELLQNEFSFFVPKMSRKDAIRLGEKYFQESIIIKDDGGFQLIYTENKEDHKVGDKAMSFKMNRKPDGQITFDPEVLKYAFSQLKKGSNNQTKQPYAFIGECTLIEEGCPPSWGEAMAHASKKEMLSIRWVRIA